MNQPLAYKVLTDAEFAALQAGAFGGAPVDVADGYIHLSTAAQLDETVKKHFAGQDGLMVAAVDLRRLGDAVRWEASRGGALFPHLYGPLTLADIRGHITLRWHEGRVVLPTA